MTQTQSNVTHQTTSPISPIDIQPIVEHGESPTAIILAISILIFVFVGSIPKLIQVIMLFSQPKRSR
ncbi:hypothetical protein [Leptolyngbya sp. 7M]|uniref:hypothetical protein n=1 Tax=Leptolyngbya sp. 7M TaxID=2812896 RepID=UPI001B8BB7C0|nr:hypothetical protein [Leptolyngbya sp. 7M]QYO63386.1 hypothetical protein JVX88_26270 [Leptolyngbya sp. 7M]